MRNGYDQYFKKAQKAAGVHSKPKTDVQSLKRAQQKSSQEMAQELRARLRPQLSAQKKRKGVPWKLAGFSLIGLLIAALGFWKAEDIEKFVHKVEISFLGSAQAQTTPAPETKPAVSAEASPEASEKKEAVVKTEFSEEEINHLSRLNERKRELDAREEELQRMEQELETQRTAINQKMAELEATRKNISNVLDEKVKADDQKVENLVQMYSSMKPPQAAKALEEMDENLAIEIIGRMKKKNAAEIMNLVKPEKVKVFTEKYAGYKAK